MWAEPFRARHGPWRPGWKSAVMGVDQSQCLLPGLAIPAPDDTGQRKSWLGSLPHGFHVKHQEAIGGDEQTVYGREKE